MYELQPPNLVYSHDHGLFFTGAAGWSAAILAGSHVPQLDGLMGALNFSAAELAPGRKELESVTDHEIASVVNSVPAAWGVGQDDLNALITYLCARRNALLGMLPLEH
jgi:hypothetical protein